MMKRIAFLHKRRFQQGASMVEFILVAPIFFSLFFGILESSYVYRSKATLNLATAQAVRAGSLENANRDAMVRTFGSNMSPLLMKAKKNREARLEAIASGVAVAEAMDARHTVVDIVHPTPAIFDKFKQKQRMIMSGETTSRVVEAIPNDNLLYRAANEQAVDGGTMSLQDANLLKISTYWCHQLLTPGLDKVIHTLVLKNSSLGIQKACNLRGDLDGNVYVAIRSHAVMRMQTPITGIDEGGGRIADGSNSESEGGDDGDGEGDNSNGDDNGSTDDGGDDDSSGNDEEDDGDNDGPERIDPDTDPEDVCGPEHITPVETNNG